MHHETPEVLARKAQTHVRIARDYNHRVVGYMKDGKGHFSVCDIQRQMRESCMAKARELLKRAGGAK